MTNQFTKFILLLIIPFLAYGKITVNVGGYNFSPYVNISDKHSPDGATISFINFLNKSQDQYEFKFIKTSAKRRYEHMRKGLFDIMFFEDRTWGWENNDQLKEINISTGGEVYIAKK